MGFNSYGQPANTAREIGPQTVEFLFNQPIDPNETVEVQVISPHGVLSGPLPLWQQKDSGSNLFRNIALGFTLAALAALGYYALALRRRRRGYLPPPHTQEKP